jgi:hypothetical protein
VSVPVALDALRAETGAERHGLVAYLCTVTDGATPHVVSVELRWDGDELVAGAGRSTCANAGARPAVSLLWPPGAEPGYSLIVDATASVADGEVRLSPTAAVLHRLAASDVEGPTCRPIG